MAQVTRRGLFLALALLVLMSDITGLRGAAAQTGDAARMAALQSKIIQIEEELRRLTGRVEQLEYEKREMSDRMDRLVADLDNRLRGLDGTSATSGNVSLPDAARVEPSVERLPEATRCAWTAQITPSTSRTSTIIELRVLTASTMVSWSTSSADPNMRLLSRPTMVNPYPVVAVEIPVLVYSNLRMLQATKWRSLKSKAVAEYRSGYGEKA